MQMHLSTVALRTEHESLALSSEAEGKDRERAMPSDLTGWVEPCVRKVTEPASFPGHKVCVYVGRLSLSLRSLSASSKMGNADERVLTSPLCQALW